MSVYPSGLDAFTPVVSGVSEIRSVDINDLQGAISAVQSTIGVSGSYNFGGISFATETFVFTTGDSSPWEVEFTLANDPIDGSIQVFFVSSNGQQLSLQYGTITGVPASIAASLTGQAFAFKSETNKMKVRDYQGYFSTSTEYRMTASYLY